jgi:phage-related protein
LETAAFEKGATAAERRLAQSAKSFEKLGGKMQDLGTKLSLGVTAPFVAFGVSATKAALESRDAMGQVDAALKSMGNAAGRTGDQLAGLATGIMRKSLYDDDEVLRKVTANLLTFGAVQGKVFDAAQQAAVDLSARLGTDLQSSAVMLGKALQDPIKGITALTRVGVNFTDQQKVQIKAMVEAGNVAGAQGIILGELNKQVGGSAEAALKAAGPMAQLKHQFDDLSETVGSAILPAIERLVPYLQAAADWFLKLSPGTQTFIVGAMGVAAALGPVLFGLGSLVKLAAPVLAGFQMIGGAIGAVEGVTLAGKVAGWATAFGSLAASLAPLLIPLAAVAAAGYLIYQNWDKIAPALEEFWQTVQTTLGPPLQELIATVSGVLSELWNGPLGEMIRAVGSRLLDFQLAYSKVMGPVLLGAIKLVIETFSNLFKSIGDGVRIVNALLSGDFAGAINAAGSLVNRIFGGLPGKVIGWMAEMVNGIRTWVVDKLTGIWDSVKTKVDQVKGYFFGLYDAVVGHSYVPDMVDGIAAQMQRLDAVMVDPARKAAKSTADAMRDMAGEVSTLLDRLFPEVRKLLDYRADLATLDKAGLAPAQDSEARRRLGLESYGIDPLSPVPLANDQGPLVTSQQVTDSIERISKALGLAADKAKTQTVQIAKSFKDMADATVQSLQNMVGAIKGGGFLDILGAVIGLVTQLGSIGAFGKGFAARINAPKVGANANGTTNWRGGLTWVGERGPELVDVPRGSRILNNRDSMEMNKLQVEVVANNNGFGAIVRNYAGQVVAEAAPVLMDGGARVAASRSAYRQTRRVG